MNKKGALALLGLNDKDRVRVGRAYGERLAVLQDKLMSAQSVIEREQARRTIDTYSRLLDPNVAAIELQTLVRAAHVLGRHLRVELVS